MDNVLLGKLNAGKRPLGAFTTFGGSSVVECLGLAGLDFVVIDTEHGVGDALSVLPSVIAAERNDMSPLVRVSGPTRPAILKMLDIGAAGLIVPYIQNIDEIKRIVEYAKYAPLGSRGYGIVRANSFGNQPLSLEEYFSASNTGTLLLPQCETAGCLNDIEAIVETDGIDGIFVGPYDLSVALGIPGKMMDEKLIAAIKRVLAACKSSKKYAFIFAGDAATALRYFDMGFDAVTCGVDSMLLTNAARDMAAKIRS